MEDSVVGVIGSPSSTTSIRLDVTGEAIHLPLLGSMVWLEQEMEGRTETGLGTVAEITTVNQWHENISMRGVIAVHGQLLGLSGRADVKGAEVNVQAVYDRCVNEYRPTGATLSMSPATGGRVYRVTDSVLSKLTAST